MAATMRKFRRWPMAALLAFAALMMAGCVTPGGYGTSPGGYGTYPGGYGQSTPGYPTQGGNQLLGTVEGVDPRSSRIVLIAEDPRTGRGQRLDLRYDQRTQLIYQGRQHAVEGLERGDVIRVDAVQSGREWWARSIEVVRNVRESGAYGGGYGDSYGNDLRGSIALVDTRSRMIRLDGAGFGSSAQVGYDGRTTVEYQGRMYRPENLQRGDQVRIQARRFGNNQWMAERIIVERSVRRY